MQKLWTRLSISQKLVFSFLGVCLSIFMLGLFAIGNWFTDSLEQNLHHEVENFAERVYQDFYHEQQDREKELKLIAERQDIVVAVERQDPSVLLKTLLPLRTGLSLDWIKVVDTKGNILMDARSPQLGQAKLLDRSIVSSVSSGAVFSDLVNVEGKPQILQTVIHPIKSSTGLLGGIIIAQLVNDDLLQKIAAGSSKQLIAMRGSQVIATTVPVTRPTNLLTLPEASIVQVAIEGQQYLARSVSFVGLNQSISIIVLYPISQLEASKRLLWFRFGLVFLLGIAIVASVGVLMARAITRPLKAVSQVAKKVTRESNFELQAPVLSQDEVGVVAVSLNQLIQQVKQLLREQQEVKQQLEIYNQTLEQQVENRTQELQKKNIDLQETLRKLTHTQLQLIQSEKMSSLGQLVAGIAHEINNPISFIHGNLQYANDYTQDLLRLVALYQKHNSNPNPEIQAAMEEVNIDYLKKDLPKLLTSMNVGTQRIREIVLSMRIFSRLDEAQFKLVNLHEGIDSTLLILQHRLKADEKHREIKVVKAYGDIPKVECFAGQLNQVFMNILSNAIDALEERERTRSLDEIDQNPSTIWIGTEITANNQISIRIIDNGPGIPEAIQKKIFEPFFTTKPVGRGTGMGMSISYEIVIEKHNGTLECFSTPETGTEFAIRIPIQQLSRDGLH